MAKISSWHFRYLLYVVWLKEARKRKGHVHPRTPLPPLGYALKSDIYLVRDSLIYELGKIVLVFDMDRSVGKIKPITTKKLRL